MSKKLLTIRLIPDASNSYYKVTQNHVFIGTVKSDNEHPDIAWKFTSKDGVIGYKKTVREAVNSLINKK